MRNAFKPFLVLILLLSAIGAVAQTVAPNGNPGTDQGNGTATAAIVVEARLNRPADLFMSHLQNDGLLDHAFMKATAKLAPTHAISTAAIVCRFDCADPGLACCSCTGFCETQTQCAKDCQK